MNTKLRLDQVAKSYGPVRALRPTSLDVPQGEFLTLLGPSGSGKSTLLQILAGLTACDQGEVWIDGRRSTDTPPHDRGIGLIFQNYALFPHLTVAQNIAFPLEMRKMPRAEIDKRVARMLEVVQLPQVGNRLPRELSGGQQQRVAFARCSVYEPSIILMDEPLGALDKRLRDDMQTEIRRLHKELGATILYVTHDQEEAMAMSDRICLMNDGGIEQLGTPSEIYFRPRSVFAAEFVGHANFVKPAPELTASDRCMVRPENIRILKEGEQADTVVEATLEDTVMLGAFSRHIARLATGERMVAVNWSDEKGAPHHPGERVRLGWDGAKAVMLSAERGR
ncbi:MAG: ABC transporter ATP-binding protein [Rhizobiaceae bacterium]